MKVLIYSFSCFCLLFTACKKESTAPATSVPASSPSAPDNIFYTDLSDTTFYSASNIPFPTIYPVDSACTCDVDVDGDLVTDFKFFSRNNFQSAGSPGCPCNVCYFCGGDIASIIGTYDGLSSLTIPGPVPQANVLSSGAIIGSALNYNSSSNIYATLGYLSWASGSSYSDKYMGFKIYRGGNYYFGWILFSNSNSALTLKSWAINKTAGNTIVAGQTM